MVSMNRMMIVKRQDGAEYFRTDTVYQHEEAHEEDYWRGLGYVVEWHEPGTEPAKPDGAFDV